MKMDKEALRECFEGLGLREKVLVCLQKASPDAVLIGSVVEEMGCIPVYAEDLRWITLVRTAFSGRVAAVAGPPQVILGLSKLASAIHTPLFIRRAVLYGAADQFWMKEDIAHALDCGAAVCRQHPEAAVDPQLAGLARSLLSWSSVLDCSVEKGPLGNELELVTIPGRKLPKLPSFARQVVRHWDPGRDTPFCLSNHRKIL